MAIISPGPEFGVGRSDRNRVRRAELREILLRRFCVTAVAACLMVTQGVALAMDASVIERYWPIIVSVGGSFIAGFLIGRIARRTMKTAAIVAGIALLVIFVLGRFGVDGSTAEQWVSASSEWVSTNVEGAGRYAASLLPSATAATIGGFLGFGRKKKRRP